MNTFFYGVLGMLVTLLLFAGGVVLGWHLRIRYDDKTKAAVHIELTEQEKKRQKEDAQAFDQLVNYGPEIAYGLHRSEDMYETSNKG
jgi:hypothetical protein